MGPTLVLAFLAVFTLLIGKALLQRKLNPYAEVSWGELPEEVRGEIERMLPGFQHRNARLTRKGDEARVEGDYQGETLRIEADFDTTGALVDFEVDTPRGFRKQQTVSPEELPEAARREIDRVLGKDCALFERTVILGGSSRGERCFEMKGHAGKWKWEIAVSECGRLIEVERKQTRRAR